MTNNEHACQPPKFPPVSLSPSSPAFPKPTYLILGNHLCVLLLKITVNYI